MNSDFPVSSDTGWSVVSRESQSGDSCVRMLNLELWSDDSIEIELPVWSSVGMPEDKPALTVFGRQQLSAKLWRAVADMLNAGISHEEIGRELLAGLQKAPPSLDMKNFEFVGYDADDSMFFANFECDVFYNWLPHVALEYLGRSSEILLTNQEEIDELLIESGIQP